MTEETQYSPEEMQAVKEFLGKFKPGDTVFNSVGNEGALRQMSYDYGILDGANRIFRGFITDIVIVNNVNGVFGLRAKWKINNVTDKIPTK